MSNYTCHSGGAKGADIAWENEGLKYGVNTIAYSFHNHQQSGKNQKILSHMELQEGYAAARIANKTLGRNFDEIPYPYVKNLLARNWFQVKNSDAVFAISKEFIKKYKVVDGGTGWAVQMAIDNNKPVYVFDQKEKHWFIYSDGSFKKLYVLPVLSYNFAGIGTRALTNDGLEGIVQIYKNTFDKK